MPNKCKHLDVLYIHPLTKFCIKNKLYELQQTTYKNKRFWVCSECNTTGY